MGKIDTSTVTCETLWYVAVLDHVLQMFSGIQGSLEKLEEFTLAKLSPCPQNM